MNAPGNEHPVWHDWWKRGTEDEATIRNDHSRACLSVRDALEALGDCYPDDNEVALVFKLARIYAPKFLKRRYR